MIFRIENNEYQKLRIWKYQILKSYEKIELWFLY